jgi:hypothetical protein
MSYYLPMVQQVEEEQCNCLESGRDEIFRLQQLSRRRQFGQMQVMIVVIVDLHSHACAIYQSMEFHPPIETH